MKFNQLLNPFLFAILIVFVISSCSPTAQIPEAEEREVEIRKVMALPDLDVNRYDRAEKMLNRNLVQMIERTSVNAEWIDETSLWYRVNTFEGFELWLVDIETESKNRLFNEPALADQLMEFDEDYAIDPNRLPVENIYVAYDHSVVYFDFDQKQWSWNRDHESLSMEKEYPDVDRPSASVQSPDGNWTAFIKDHNLWVRNMQTGEDLQLTTDGEEGFGYATDSQGWTRSNRPILYWSEDSRLISTYQLDERKVEKMHLLRMDDRRPELVSWPYALPGDEHVPMHHRVVIDLENQRKTRLQTEPYHQRTSNCCGLTRGPFWADNQFSNDGRYLAYVATSRDYKEVTLKIADVRTGEVRTVFSERDEKFIETNLTSRGIPNWRVLFDSDEFIWFSRRDNWGHLYLYDLSTGEEKEQITTGDWNVVDILNIDTDRRKIWFNGVGMNPDFDPYQEYAYSINFDGTGLRNYTPDEGHHEILFSNGGSYLLDTFSDVTTPPVTVIRDEFGEVVMTLETADASDLIASGWREPLAFSSKARDGETDIYGMVYKPSDFDESQTYPVVINIYPGPQIGSVGTRGFSPARRGNTHALAELGFIVVQIDGFGTPMRSREFHTYYYGDMSDNGLPDQIAAVEYLAAMYPWVDIDRVGIYGHSGGGFATAAALFNHPEFFKVGVSSAGNLDNRGYTFYWGEKFQGPFEQFDEDTDSFTNQALQLQVQGLEGKLLLSYGTMDSNVHPNMTHLVIDALIEHNKDFDLMVMPNRGHGYANEAYKIRRTWDYFVKHLLHMQPPREFEL